MENTENKPTNHLEQEIARLEEIYDKLNEYAIETYGIDICGIESNILFNRALLNETED